MSQRRRDKRGSTGGTWFSTVAVVAISHDEMKVRQPLVASSLSAVGVSVAAFRVTSLLT